MKIWLQLNDHDEDQQFADDATYEVLDGGVLKVVSGSDIHLYSPAYWQTSTIDTRSADERERQALPQDDDLRWQ